MTAAKFHASNKVVRGFMGPVGNGKSVTCIQELWRNAKEQWPNSEGIRKTRYAIIRNTSLELRTTTLNTFKQWFPEEMCHYTLSPLITANIKQRIENDGTIIETEFIFLALDREDDVKKLLSLELTGVFINECREIFYAIVKGARERIGRYPARVDGYADTETYKAPRNAEGGYEPCRRKMLIMDTNPTDDMHWWYQLAEDGCLRTNKTEKAKSAVSEIFEFFRGPAPLIKDGEDYVPNPLAENIEFLPGGYQYYMDMIAGNTVDHINVMVLGNYGTIKAGKPVYPQYNDGIHCPGKVPVIVSLPICMGWDFGLTPAVIFGQLTDLGQLRIVAELIAEDMNVRQFARDIVKPFIAKHFYDMKIGFSLGDPSGNARGEGEGKTAIGILNDDYVDNDFGDIVTPLKMGFTTEGAPTNDIPKRIDAVESFMIRLVDGGQPGYQISKGCKMLRKGKLGGYHFRKMKVAGQERYNDKPEKDMYSHSSDAEQYLALGFAGGYVIDYSPSDEYDEYNEYNEIGSGGY